MRALFNFAKAEYKSSEGRSLFPENPVDALSEKRNWNNVKRTTTRLRRSQLKPFIDALYEVRNEAAKYRQNSRVGFCDYLEFLTFSGLRRSELLQLPWSQVHLEDRIFILEDTKNGLDVEFPITDRLAEIFNRRKEYKVSDYVFGTNSKKGYLTDPKKTLKHVCQIAGVKITSHDLRRTFTSMAESSGVSGYLLKRLLNHITDKSDVTAGYLILTAEELKEPAEKVTETIAKYADLIEQEPENKMSEMKSLLASLTKEQKVELMSALLQ